MINVPAIRDMVDTIKDRYGDNAHVILYSDGSGFICYNESGANVVDFDGLGELQSTLESDQ